MAQERKVLQVTYIERCDETAINTMKTDHAGLLSSGENDE